MSVTSAHRIWFERAEKRLAWVNEHLSWAQDKMDYYSTAPHKNKGKYREYWTIRYVLQYEKRYLIEHLGLVRGSDKMEIDVLNWRETLGPEPPPPDPWEETKRLLFMTAFIIGSMLLAIWLATVIS
jgi:hypothetical protein